MNRERWRKSAFFALGFLVMPLLITLIYRLLPERWPWGVGLAALLAIISLVGLVWRQPHAAAGMVVAGLLWLAFIFWVTETASPDWD